MVEDGHHDLSRLLAPENNVVYSGHFDQKLETSHIPAREIPDFLSCLSLLGYLPNSRRASYVHPPQDERSDTTKWISMQGDWALVRIHHPRYFNPNRFVMPEGPGIVPSRTSESPPRGKVFLATNHSQLRPSYFSGVKGLFLPGSAKMKETWALDTQCGPGDCGAWVLGAESEGVLHGIIAASSKVNNASYILPAANIFEDIKTSWKAEVQSSDHLLPTGNVESSMLDLEADIPIFLDNDPKSNVPISMHHPASPMEKDAFPRKRLLSDYITPMLSLKFSSISPPALSDSSAASTIADLEDIAPQQANAEAADVLIGLDTFKNLVSPKDALIDSEVCLFKLVAFDET